MSAPAASQPSIYTRIHCPAIDCRYVANTRSHAAAHAALADHVACCHGSLMQTTVTPA